MENVERGGGVGGGGEIKKKRREPVFSLNDFPRLCVSMAAREEKRKKIAEAGVWEAVKRAENVLSRTKTLMMWACKLTHASQLEINPPVPRPSLESDHDDRFLAEKKRMGGVNV